MTPAKNSSVGAARNSSESPVASKHTVSSRQLAAVATAAIPVVMLSSLALATPANAAPAKTQALPHGLHGSLDSGKVVAAVAARTSGSAIPASVVASSVPRAVTAMSPALATSSFSHGTHAAIKPALPSVAPTQPTNITHTVAAGDTVWAIAGQYGVSVASVLERNSLNADDIIHPGQVLAISGNSAPAAHAERPQSSSYTVRAGDTLSGIAAEHGINLAHIFSLNNLNENSVIHPGQQVKVSGAATEASAPERTQSAAAGSYVINAGDTLSAIAAAHGVSLESLTAANGLTARDTIYQGKTLTIPGLGAASSSIVPDAANVPELAPEDRVPSTFLHYQYPQAVVNDANRNKALLLASPAPSPQQMKEMVANTAAAMGVDPALAMAFAQQESGFNHQSVSPANAIGTMQVIPDAGDWASGLVGRKLNLLDPQDNVTAGVAIIHALFQNANSEDDAIAGYYQGAYSVSVNGLFSDTVNYVAGIKANREMFR